MNAWQIFGVFGAGLAAGIALGWLGGHMVGFYLGRRLERKRLSKLLAGKTAIEIVTQLMETGTIKPTEKKKAGPKQVWPPRDETRH